jgi:hypothetical protein
MSDQQLSTDELELNQSLKQATYFWAFADIVYGAVISLLSWNFIPRTTAKLPEVVWGLSIWGGLHVLLALLTLMSLFLARKKVLNLLWRCNIGLSLITVTLGLVLATLCLTSGLYWLGVFGVLGWGVFILSLLLISGVL